MNNKSRFNSLHTQANKAFRPYRVMELLLDFMEESNSPPDFILCPPILTFNDLYDKPQKKNARYFSNKVD